MTDSNEADKPLELDSKNHYLLVQHDKNVVEVVQYGPSCPHMGDAGYTGQISLGLFPFDAPMRWSWWRRSEEEPDTEEEIVYTTRFENLDFTDTPICGDNFIRSLCVADPTADLWTDYY